MRCQGRSGESLSGYPMETQKFGKQGQECGAASELKEKPGSGHGCGGQERL